MSIHTMSATTLLHHLGSGELSSVEIVDALIERRESVDGQINAFALVREQARSEAALADQARLENRQLGPLAGLPMTIKENLELAGTDSTMGVKRLENQPATETAVVVEELRQRGAIVLGKTNVPQLLLAQECESSVYGVTNNPWDLSRVPGGSSGGEAAALATGMSPLGVGTDIGGSIRIPAHFCGVAGLKPTLDRWSNRGSRGAVPGQELVRAQIGPMARTVEDLALLWRSLEPAWQSRRDPNVPPLSASDGADLDLSGMRIGYWDDDDFLSPVPAMRRAVHRAMAALEDAGAKLISHQPVASEEVLYLWLAAVTSDGGQTLDEAVGDEAYSAQLKSSRAVLRLPGPVRRTLGRLMKATGEKRIGRLLQILGEKPVHDYWQLVQRRTELKRIELDRWNSADLDAFVCPSHVVPAMGHRESGDFTLSVGPMVRWTTLAFPAGVVPISRVRADEVGVLGSAGDRLEKKRHSIDVGSQGLPVSAQIVARPFREDVALRVMGAIFDSASRDDDFPATPIDPVQK